MKRRSVSLQGGDIVTNIEKIKAMSTEELAIFLLNLGNVETMLDHHYCTKCKKENGGRCPIADDEECLYGFNDSVLMQGWLESEVV